MNQDISTPIIPCIYCGSTRCIARRVRGLNQIENKFRITIRRPVCGTCITKIKATGREPNNHSSDYVINQELKDIKVALSSLPKTTSLETFLLLDDKLKALDRHVRYAEGDFEKAAEKAALLGARVSELLSARAFAKELVAGRINRTYETLRKVANDTIKDPKLRQLVFERDGFKCVACSSLEFLSVDHIIPIRAGGGNTDSNLQTLCLPCNCSKRDKEDSEWRGRGIAKDLAGVADRMPRHTTRRAFREEKRRALAVEREYQKAYIAEATA